MDSHLCTVARREHLEVVGAIILKPLVSYTTKTLRLLNLVVSQLLKLGCRQVQNTLGSRYYLEKSQSRPDQGCVCNAAVGSEIKRSVIGRDLGAKRAQVAAVFYKRLFNPRSYPKL
jgi:hypothetical protein